MESATLSGIKLSKHEIETAVNYIAAHGDHTAYHLLFALRRHALDAFRSLPNITKAHVLSDALVRQTYLNDWGYLDPGGSHDGEAAKALLELGSDVFQPLLPMLDNSQPARLFGTEEATISALYQYRRKDFAYRYLALITGRQPTFEADPQSRDAKIEDLKMELNTGD